MQVHRYSDNLYRSFSSREEAVQAFNKFVEDHGDPSHNAETSTSCSSTSTSKDAKYKRICIQVPFLWVRRGNIIKRTKLNSSMETMLRGK
nr:uncharacterized protein LOC109185007 [Ipomoea batatas]